jgi:hypothetical protein
MHHEGSGRASLPGPLVFVNEKVKSEKVEKGDGLKAKRLDD